MHHTLRFIKIIRNYYNYFLYAEIHIKYKRILNKLYERNVGRSNFNSGHYILLNFFFKVIELLLLKCTSIKIKEYK